MKHLPDCLPSLPVKATLQFLGRHVVSPNRPQKQMSPKAMSPTTKKSAVRVTGSTDQSKTTIKNPKSSKTMTSGTTILQSSNYDQFVACPFNRDTDASLLRKIKATMKKYGFLPGYPLHCWQGTGTQKGKLVIKDGQARFEAAKELGLPISYIINTREPLRW